MPRSFEGRVAGARARRRNGGCSAPRERIWLGALLIELWMVAPVIVVLALVELSELLEAAPPIWLS